MNRQSMLREVTGLMGDALAELEAKGVEIDNRSIRLFIDAFCDLYKAAPEPQGLRSLIAAIERDELNHGGLIGKDTLHLANVLKLAVNS